MVMRLPSFRSLLGFEAAARLGNYSRAAEELCISQSAISHQMLQLEQQLGQPLFRRKGRGVELTVAGRLLLESVTRSLDVMFR
jgi:LysR family transcriptional regulator, glycine cleavage system transcriptional activator